MHFRNRLRATPAEKQHILENIDPQSRPSHKSRYAIPRSPVFDAWRQSRRAYRSSEPLPAGSQRPVTLSNIFAAAVIVRSCMVDLFILLFNLHPTRTLLLVVFNILRGTLPSVRGYSQARILDEAQNLFSSDRYDFSRLFKLILTDAFRMFAETLLDVVANHNEEIVQRSSRFHVEFLQMQTRLRLDLPALANPSVRDVLFESDAFVRSFSSGMGSFLLLSPFEMIRIFTTISEILSQSFVLWSMSLSSARAFHTSQHWAELLILGLAIFPTLFSFFNSCFAFPLSDRWSQSLQDSEDARLEERHERMRGLAYSDSFKPEVLLFGLRTWILQSWADAKRSLMIRSVSLGESTGTAARTFARTSAIEFFSLIQTLPLALQFSSASLGSVTLYRTTAEMLVQTVFTLATSMRLFYQGIFLLGAFHIGLSLKPALQPDEADKVEYTGTRGPKKGMKIDIRDMSFTYPGKTEPTLYNINFHVEPGEIIALCGLNGSGKSTFAHLITRLYDYDDGQFTINDVDVRKYDAEDLHKHTTVVFQNFSRYNTTLRENVGVGQIDLLEKDPYLRDALRAGGGARLLNLPSGLDTSLEYSGFDFSFPSPFPLDPLGFGGVGSTVPDRCALSGGEWQRVAISRAFMRPDADLCVFDEPSSALDAAAQNDLFERLTKGNRPPKGEQKSTIIFVTHRLSTVRQAHKVAMFENGTITEFGTHGDLIAKDGAYAALYKAFMSSDSP